MPDYGIVHDGKTFTPNATAGIDPAESDARNREIEQYELKRWATKPDRALGYYDDKKQTVTTWLGTIIGTILTARVYKHNFGGRMIALTMRGTNGATYYGRASYDWGTCINLRRGARHMAEDTK